MRRCSREAVDRKLLAKHQVAPLAKRQSRITATADPSNLRALDEIRFQTGLQIELVIVEADKLKRAVEAPVESGCRHAQGAHRRSLSTWTCCRDGPR